jgi:hypothetical protein
MLYITTTKDQRSCQDAFTKSNEFDHFRRKILIDLDLTQTVVASILIQGSRNLN